MSAQTAVTKFVDKNGRRRCTGNKHDYGYAELWLAMESKTQCSPGLVTAKARLVALQQCRLLWRLAVGPLKVLRLWERRRRWR